MFPEFIEVSGNRALVVDQFKLLGITLDNTLNFCKHVSNALKAINTKLFSIKRRLFLPRVLINCISNPLKLQT